MAQGTLERTQVAQAQMTWNWQPLVRAALIAGIIVVYTSAVGMVETFNEREVVRDWLTLGQIILFAPAIIAGYVTARRAKADGQSVLTLLLNGAFVGAVSAVPVLLLILIGSTLDIRDIFINISRQLMEILTFDNESRLLGSLMFVIFAMLGSLFGTALILLPERPRQALLTGIGVVIGVGLLGELVTLVLRQFVSRDAIELVFRRDELKLVGAVGIFLLTTLLTGLWIYNAQTIRSSYHSLPSGRQQTVQRSGATALGIFLLVLPWLVGTFLSEVINNIGLYILMGLGLNIAIGLAGLLDLGYVTNFAVGAYVMGVLTSTGPLGIEEKLGVGVFNFWLVLPVSLLVAMFTGFIFAVPVLRMRGDYLAIATLGFGEIIGKLALSDALRPVIGGAQGVLFIPNPEFAFLTGTPLEWLNELAVVDSPEEFYYIILAACALALFVSIRINNSRVGRQWMSIREDEDVASAMGIDTARSKLLAFTLSAATGGLAGAIFAARLGTIFPNSFNVLVSINVLSLIIVGGMGSIPGIVVGAVVLIGLPELLREFSEFRFLLYGALLVFMMVSRPEGLWPSQVMRREIRSEDEDDPLRGGDGDESASNSASSDSEATVK